MALHREALSNGDPDDDATASTSTRKKSRTITDFPAI
jgi:hypothetical protein